MAVGISQVSVEGERIAQPLFIPISSLAFEHWDLIEEIGDCCFVVHHRSLPFLLSVEVVLESLEYRLFGVGVALEVVALLKLFQGSLFLFAQCLRHIDADGYYKVASAVAIVLYRGQSLTSQAQCLAWLRTTFSLHLEAGTLDGRNLHLSA